MSVNLNVLRNGIKFDDFKDGIDSSVTQKIHKLHVGKVNMLGFIEQNQILGFEARTEYGTKQTILEVLIRACMKKRPITSKLTDQESDAIHKITKDLRADKENNLLVSSLRQPVKEKILNLLADYN